jgi:hypothetical protein
VCMHLIHSIKNDDVQKIKQQLNLPVELGNASREQQVNDIKLIGIVNINVMSSATVFL